MKKKKSLNRKIVRMLTILGLVSILITIAKTVDINTINIDINERLGKLPNRTNPNNIPYINKDCNLNLLRELWGILSGIILNN